MIPKKYISFFKFEREKIAVLRLHSFRIHVPEEKIVKIISLINICKNKYPLIIFLDGFLGL